MFHRPIIRMIHDSSFANAKPKFMTEAKIKQILNSFAICHRESVRIFDFLDIFYLKILILFYFICIFAPAFAEIKAIYKPSKLFSLWLNI